MTASRATGLAILSALMASAMLASCVSGRGKSAPDETAAAAPSAVPVAPEPSPSSAEAQPPANPPAMTETPSAAPAASDRVEFSSHILPILQEKCSPCHFPGGRMYDELPFDKEGTILVLGTKLLTRLREPLDQELIRTYLDQP